MQPFAIATFLGISLESWLTMLAIVGGPISALLIQRKIDRGTASKDRKLRIFRDLMANRAARLSPQFVQSLNAIEVEFYGENEVIAAWREYISHLLTHFPIEKSEGEQREWNDKATDHLNKLLHEIAGVLAYRFDPLTLKRNAYYPMGWGQVELDQIQLRQASLEVFGGKRALKMEISKPVTILSDATSALAPPAADAKVVPAAREQVLPPQAEKKE